MTQLTQTTKILAAALANLLEVATFDHAGTEMDWMRFNSAAAVAGDVLVEAQTTSESSLELALKLAGSLRALRDQANAKPGADERELAKYQRIYRDAGTALLHFDALSFHLHAHFETAIYRDDEEFNVIALTTHDEAEFDKTGSPGDVFAYVPFQCPAGVEFASRMARLAAQPIYGDGQQVGNALRASKALIEALLRGDRRSEGDMRDVLANFDGLALI